VGGGVVTGEGGGREDDEIFGDKCIQIHTCTHMAQR